MCLFEGNVVFCVVEMIKLLVCFGLFDVLFVNFELVKDVKFLYFDIIIGFTETL